MQMPEFENSLPMILSRTLDAVMPPYRELFRRFDLTEQQWRVLRVLWSNDRVTSAQLAEQTILLQPSLVGILDRLEKKQLISRSRSAIDRRVVYVAASPEGRELQEQVLPEVELIHQRLQAAVSENEWKSMQATLEKISAKMVEDESHQLVSDNTHKKLKIEAI